MSKTKKIFAKVEVPVGGYCFGRNTWGEMDNYCDHLGIESDWCRLFQVDLKEDSYISLAQKCEQCLNAADCTEVS